MRNNDDSSQTTLLAVKALAVATEAPFKTAFKATLGIAAAQLVLLASLVAFMTMVVSATYLLVTS